ncbi:MAG: hypothetical protein ACRYF5_19675, partial [Janthinobacterium lividum]
ASATSSAVTSGASEASQSFKDSIKGGDPGKLLGMMMDRSLSTADKNAVMAELTDQMKKAFAGGADGAGDSDSAEDEDAVKKLLQKLAKGEKLSTDEVQKLSSALGVDPADATDTQNNSGSSDSSSAGSTEITGG